MNYAQWAFMAESFRRKENEAQKQQTELITEVFKAATRTFRELLVSLLGLSLGAGRAANEDDPTPFFPLVTLLGRSELVEELLQRSTEEAEIAQVSTDPNVDVVNERLMQLDEGDLEPILSGINSPDPFARWMSPENQSRLKLAGVELHEGDKGFIESDDE